MPRRTRRARRLLVFRAGSSQPKAVPLSLITRLEEIDAQKIELSNGRHMVQYRGHLMPLVSMSEDVRVKAEGAQSLLVFSDGSRSMALVVDEIVDIVDDNLDIQVTSDNPGVLGSAIVRGQATEIIDVGHFLPLAFEDWFRRKEQPVQHRARTVLLVDDSPFFLNMLTPVLQAAGYEVTAVSSAHDALARCSKRAALFDVVITDIEMPEMDGFQFAEARASRPAHRRIADYRAVVGRVGRSDRARPPRRLPRLCRQVRPAGTDRSAQGTDRRRSGGVTGKP